MYRVPKPPEARSQKDNWLKWLRVVAYSCMGTAGLLLLLSPVLAVVHTTTAEVMAWFLFVGGLLSAIGAFREEWWGEFVGLPPLGFSLAAFGVISWRSAEGAHPYIAAGNLFLLIGVGIATAARWRDARNTYRIAVFGTKLRDEEPPL